MCNMLNNYISMYTVTLLVNVNDCTLTCIKNFTPYPIEYHG